MTNVNYISGAVAPQGGPQVGTRKGRSFEMIDLGRINLTDVTATHELKYVANRNGRILGIFVFCSAPTTDTNADGTVTSEISGVVTTGGVVTIADVNDGTNPFDTANKLFSGTAITAANVFKVGDYLDAKWAFTNAFIDGYARVVLAVEYDYGA